MEEDDSQLLEEEGGSGDDERCALCSSLRARTTLFDAPPTRAFDAPPTRARTHNSAASPPLMFVFAHIRPVDHGVANPNTLHHRQSPPPPPPPPPPPQQQQQQHPPQRITEEEARSQYRLKGKDLDGLPTPPLLKYVRSEVEVRG
jgi:hypothetical protein